MLWKTPAALCPMISKYREIVGREIVVPMTVEYRNGVQSSTISYSNMVIPEVEFANSEDPSLDLHCLLFSV